MDSDTASDELSPLPQLQPINCSVPLRLRRRAPFAEPSDANADLYEPTLAAPDQVISSLISSLSAISESAPPDSFSTRTGSGIGEPLFDPSSATVVRSGSPDSFYADIPLRRHGCPDQVPDVDGESDDESAIPPVVHLVRSSSSPRKRKGRRRSPRTHLTAIPGLCQKNSMHSLRSHDGSVGFPSIERANGSSNSLPITMRGVSSRSSSKTRDPDRHPLASSVRALGQRSYPDMAAEQSKGCHSPRFSFDMSHEPVRRSSALSSSESPALNALSPLNRDDLQDHLIPSRFSSLRRNGSLVDDRESHRLSVGSRSLKDLKIDQDLLESDHYTIRRIRELQEARERRQLEGRREARKLADRPPSKRHSVPGTKLSVTEVLVESDQEGLLDLSATVSDDMGILPTLIPRHAPGTPHEIHSTAYSRLTAASPTPWQKSGPIRMLHSSSSSFSSSSTRQCKRNSAGSRAQLLENSHAISHAINSDPVRSTQEEVDAFLSSPRLTQKIRHPRTGRAIAFSEVGDPNGFAVICCVGMGLTRYVTTFYDDLARTLKLRLITPDRPGVGESEAAPERLHNPLTWVDDVAIICHTLGISRFSLLAHSAGAIYALATALKMPQFVRGRIHLLAPWIPPSQMPKGAAAFGPHSQPITNLPMSHRLLSVLPSSVFKVANSRFLAGMAATSTSESKLLKKKKTKNHDLVEAEMSSSLTEKLADHALDDFLNRSGNPDSPSPAKTKTSDVPASQANGHAGPAASPERRPQVPVPRMTPEARASLYNEALTRKIWALSTLNANPAIDLMICLERKKPIGFKYADVTRSTVITHGAKDTRVPLHNVRWLNSVMKRCELRVLEDEGHSLMANASVMSSILTEKAKEWEEWEKIAAAKKKKKRREESSSSSSFMRAPRSVLSVQGLAARAAAQSHDSDAF